MRIHNRYFINNQEVDVSTYSIQVAKGIPGEYKIKTEEDYIDESVIDRIYQVSEKLSEKSDELQEKINNLECRMYADVNYNLQRLGDRFKTLIDILNEIELSDEVRSKLNDLKYYY